MSKSRLIKASGAIATEGKLSLLEERIWNILLANAYDELPEKRTHTIHASELIQQLDETISDYTTLMGYIQRIVETSTGWNLLNKDRRIWGIFSYLSSAVLDEDSGVLSYSFPEISTALLHQPPMYIQLSLKTQNEIKSKHALKLYQILIDYYIEKRGQGETPFIPLETYQNILGTNYAEWRHIKERLIVEPLEKIAPFVPFTITTEFRKNRKKIAAVKFVMKRKRTTQPAKLLPAQITQTTFAPVKTFAELPIGADYRIIGGTETTFKKISDTQAQKHGAKAPITMQNIHVAVIPL